MLKRYPPDISTWKQPPSEGELGARRNDSPFPGSPGPPRTSTTAVLVLWAALQSRVGDIPHRHRTEPTVEAAEATDGIVVGGVQDEDDRAEATAAITSIQLDPDEGRPASERGEVRVLVGRDV